MSMITTCILKITAFDINMNMKIAHKNYNSMFRLGCFFPLCSAAINILCTYWPQFQLSSHIKFVSPFVSFFTLYGKIYCMLFLNVWIILSLLWPGAIIPWQWVQFSGMKHISAPKAFRCPVRLQLLYYSFMHCTCCLGSSNLFYIL